jgi:hypothetical protein
MFRPQLIWQCYILNRVIEGIPPWVGVVCPMGWNMVSFYFYYSMAAKGMPSTERAGASHVVVLGAHEAG